MHAHYRVKSDRRWECSGVRRQGRDLTFAACLSPVCVVYIMHANWKTPDAGRDCCRERSFAWGARSARRRRAENRGRIAADRARNHDDIGRNRSAKGAHSPCVREQRRLCSGDRRTDRASQRLCRRTGFCYDCRRCVECVGSKTGFARTCFGSGLDEARVRFQMASERPRSYWDFRTSFRASRFGIGDSLALRRGRKPRRLRPVPARIGERLMSLWAQGQPQMGVSAGMTAFQASARSSLMSISRSI